VIIPSRLNAIFFVCGVLLAMTGLALAGNLVFPEELAHGFLRFHAGIGPDYNFFPTAREIKATLDRNAGDDSKVTVIIGGSSVFHGTGQKHPRIWTELLQKDLGDRFRVLNFAVRAGAANGFGEIPAEMALQEGRPFIYVCDNNIQGFAAPVERSFFRKTYFDAWQRGYLLSWPARDRMMRDALWGQSDNLREASWGAVLDSYLNFNDFWNYVTFRYTGTIWNSLAALDSFEPLRKSDDPENSPGWSASVPYPPIGSDDNAHAMSVVRGEIFGSGPDQWNAAQGQIELYVPPALRAKTLSVTHLNSPYFTTQLTAQERQEFFQQATRFALFLKQLGFHQAIAVPNDWDKDDYHDVVHLSMQGGQKLADLLAPEIVKMAMELGYIK
jgi:hypothetical protein